MINRNVLLMEIRRSYLSLIIWSVSMGLTMLFVVILYPMVKDMYATIPEEFMQFIESFGGIPKNIIEYFSTEGGMTLQIFSAIFAAMLGFNALSREEREKAHDTIYSLPVSRNTFFRTKFLSVFLQVIFYSVVVTLFTVIGFFLVEKVNIGRFLVFMLLNTVMLLVVAILGFTLAGLLKIAMKTGIALVIPFPLYILSMVVALTDNKILDLLKYLTPFTFADPVSYLKLNDSVEFISLLVFVVICSGLLIIANYRFKNKDFS